MKRRQILKAGGLVIALPSLAFLNAGARTRAASIEEMQLRWHEFHAAGFEPVAAEPSLNRPLEAWRHDLPKAAYRVLFEEDTERQFSSPLNDEKRPGLFVCRACELPLFTSEMKYDSRTGWPSFFTEIPGHLATKTDYKLIWPRTEYHCVKCGGHQGHLFDDGPAPTGQRWCNNGLALDFIELAPASASN
jgi:peptide-methionine (R)-S-oxide reductase